MYNCLHYCDLKQKIDRWKERAGTACGTSYRVQDTGRGQENQSGRATNTDADRICPMCGNIPVLKGNLYSGVRWVGDCDTDLYRENRATVTPEKRTAIVRLTAMSDPFEARTGSQLALMLDYGVGLKTDLREIPDAKIHIMLQKRFHIGVELVNCRNDETVILYRNETACKIKDIELTRVLGKGLYRYRVDLKYGVQYKEQPVVGDLPFSVTAVAYFTAYMGNREDGSLRQGRLIDYSGAYEKKKKKF